MSVNREQPHVLVLVEDDANRQVLVGFESYYALRHRAMQVLRPAGGWRKVIETFLETYVKAMRAYPETRMVLVIDFDEDENRLEGVRQQIPEDLRERVFIAGAWTEPEGLKRVFRKDYEELGVLLAEDCHTGAEGNPWQSELLHHNQPELERMKQALSPIVFDS